MSNEPFKSPLRYCRYASGNEYFLVCMLDSAVRKETVMCGHDDVDTCADADGRDIIVET